MCVEKVMGKDAEKKIKLRVNDSFQVCNLQNTMPTEEPHLVPTLCPSRILCTRYEMYVGKLLI